MKRLSLRGCALLLFTLLPLTGAAEGKLSMKDMEALHGQKAWREILRRADDVAPSERTARWEAILTTAATQHLSANAEGQEALEGFFLCEDLLKEHAFLKKSREFMDKRANVGLKAFALCFDNSWSGSGCVNRLKPFAQADPGNATLQLDLAKLVRLKQNAQVAVPYFKLALTSAKDKGKVCKDPDFALATTAGLGLPPDYPDFATAKEMIFGPCWGEMKAPVLKSLTDASGYYKDNVCAALKEKKQLPADKSKLCAGG